MSEFKNQDGFPAQPSIRQWYLLPGLVLFVCLSFYWSFSTQVLGRDHTAVEVLTSQVAAVNDSSPAMTDRLGLWLVDVRRLLPLMSRFAPTTSTVAVPFQELTQKLERSGTVTPADQRSLRRELVLAEVALRRHQQYLNDAYIRQTSYFYTSFVAILLLLFVAMFTRSSRTVTALQQLVDETYVFDHAPVAMAVSDRQNRYLRVNEHFENATGFDKEALLGHTSVHADAEGMHEALLNHGMWVGEQSLRRQDGSVAIDKILRLAVGDDIARPQGYLSISMDPVMSDDGRQLMLWQAHHDSLTKLPNANLLHERLVRGLSGAQAEQKLGALISVDLDDFQKVNDSVGHEIADRVLTDAAYRIAMCARESDTVARTGGDHFVIAMLEIDAVEQAEHTARAVVESMAPPFHMGGREIFLTASAGLTIFPQDGLDRGELLQKG